MRQQVGVIREGRNGGPVEQTGPFFGLFFVSKASRRLKGKRLNAPPWG
jgi:hypothetical protein